jgi:hypothetical protein
MLIAILTLHSALAEQGTNTSKDASVSKEVPTDKNKDASVSKEVPTDKNKDASESKEASTESIDGNMIPMISSGIDATIALLRTSAASKKDIETLNPVTVIDLAGNHPAILLSKTGDGPAVPSSVIGCSGSVMSNSRLKVLTQTADNDLAYYELENAQKRLESAVKGIICLQDTLEVDVVQRMYFLQGILDHSMDKPDEATKAFSLAIRFKPDLQWDDNFPPDAQKLFIEAKKSFSKAKEIPLTISPVSATPNIWVNGVALTSGATHFLYEGENIVQVLGATIQTHKVMVNSDVESLQLVVPSTMPIDSNTWVSDEAKRGELDFVLSNILPTGSELYVHNSGEVWTTNIGTTEWAQLDVPRYVENRANAKVISGKVLFWTGIGAMASGLGYSGYHYIQGLDSVSTAKSTEDYLAYADQLNDHTTQQANYQIGWIITGSGIALGGLGYTLAF